MGRVSSQRRKGEGGIVRAAAAVSPIAAAGLFGCETVNIPASDATPPTLRWIVLEQGPNRTTEFDTSGEFEAAAGKSYTVLMRVEDPQGVARVSRSGAAEYTCSNAADIANRAVVDILTEVEEPRPAEAGRAYKVWIMPTETTIGTWTCRQPGFSFDGGYITFFGEGENFHGGVVNGSLEIRRPAD